MRPLGCLISDCFIDGKFEINYREMPALKIRQRLAFKMPVVVLERRSHKQNFIQNNESIFVAKSPLLIGSP